MIVTWSVSADNARAVTEASLRFDLGLCVRFRPTDLLICGRYMRLAQRARQVPRLFAVPRERHIESLGCGGRSAHSIDAIPRFEPASRKLPDALLHAQVSGEEVDRQRSLRTGNLNMSEAAVAHRSEEHTSELQSPMYL